MLGGLDLAFVLRVSNKHSKVVLLDRGQGKFELHSRASSSIYNGLLIKYDAESKYLLNVTDWYPLSSKFGNKRLKFYHLILEICENFIPIGLESPDIFDLIYFLYFSFENFDSQISQKIFLYKLFSQLGIDSGDKKFSKLLNLLSNPIDRVINQALDLEIEELLNDFIKYTLDLNSSIYVFNTRCFFSDVGIL